ncbi:large ribosomal subunit protein mL55-like [Antedon mediterranea]|uniref:large ribosomal subunit protein mL55-like n=1 Tax=Antedon mediterranea TaxID=105859 RepID=UPI003AF81E93
MFILCRFLRQSSAVFAQQCRMNSHRSSIAKTNRNVYARMYPTLIVNTDGSTYRIKYHEPKKILKLPMNIDMMHADERKARMQQYQPKAKKTVEEDIDDDFTEQKYKHLWKK